MSVERTEKIPVETAAGDGGAAVRTAIVMRQVAVSASFARPSDSTPYGANDAVANSTSAPTVLNFADVVGGVGMSGEIVKVRLMTNQSTNQARFRLHLFHTAPTPINDNAAHTILYANRANRIGSVTLPLCSTAGSGSDAANSIAVPGTPLSNVPLAFTCAADDTDLYGMLEALDAFTPASGQQFFIEITVK